MSATISEARRKDERVESARRREVPLVLNKCCN